MSMKQFVNNKNNTEKEKDFASLRNKNRRHIEMFTIKITSNNSSKCNERMCTSSLRKNIDVLIV